MNPKLDKRKKNKEVWDKYYNSKKTISIYDKEMKQSFNG